MPAIGTVVRSNYDCIVIARIGAVSTISVASVATITISIPVRRAATAAGAGRLYDDGRRSIAAVSVSASGGGRSSAESKP